jgi:hypothetical protein
LKVTSSGLIFDRPITLQVAVGARIYRTAKIDPSITGIHLVGPTPLHTRRRAPMEEDPALPIGNHSKVACLQIKTPAPAVPLQFTAH